MSQVMNSCLDDAVRNGDMVAARKAIRNGADVNSRNKKGWTPLMVLVAECRTGKRDAFAKFLIDLGADPHARNNAEGSARGLALFRQDTRLVNALAAAGVNMDELDFDFSPSGRKDPSYMLTPLIYAIRCGNRALVRCLLDLGVDPELCDSRGVSPQTHASLSRDWLLDHYVWAAIDYRMYLKYRHLLAA